MKYEERQMAGGRTSTSVDGGNQCAANRQPEVRSSGIRSDGAVKLGGRGGDWAYLVYVVVVVVVKKKTKTKPKDGVMLKDG